MLRQIGKLFVVLLFCSLGVFLVGYIKRISFTSFTHTISFPTETIAIPLRYPIVPSQLLTSDAQLLSQYNLQFSLSSDAKNILLYPATGSQWPSDVSLSIPLKYGPVVLGTVDINTLPSTISATAQKNIEIIQLDYPLAQELPIKTDSLIVDYISPRKLRVRSNLPQAECIRIIEDRLSHRSDDLLDHEYVFEKL